MSGELHIFTSAAVNYLPKVRILCRSIRRHHPEAVIHLALADARPDWLAVEGEPFDDVIDVAGLSIPDWKRWAFGHEIVELATAIKPFALARLLALPGCRTVLYFDPDIVLFSRVDDILALLARSNVALTPHQTQPETTLEAVLDNEVASLKHGIFNLGFIGVTRSDEGMRFARWWGERTWALCRDDIPNGLFTDQKWVNFAPVFFDGVAIVKSPRHNVATWNLTTRTMTGNFAGGFFIDDEPLGFYHFTGFDSGAHRIMAIKNATRNTAVGELIGWYEREIEVADNDPVSRTPWAFGRYSDGTAIEGWQRRLYRDRTDLHDAFPDPFDAKYLDWCRTEGRFQVGHDAALRAPFKGAAAIRLAALALAPRAGRSLRRRILRIVRTEGMPGIVRRLRARRGRFAR